MHKITEEMCWSSQCQINNISKCSNCFYLFFQGFM